jgi:hypothetical protein
MTARRRLLAAASATTALLALTGCEKPAPIVTVVSGGESVYTEAARFCFEEGQTLAADACSERARQLPRLETRQGERIGIDVDRELVDRGWQLEIVDPADPQRTQASATIRDHYFPFTAPGIAPQGRLLLTIRTVAGPDEVPTGEWRFELVSSE